ncbi:MAG: glycosyltransferase family 2 protein [Candidatus Melainabacteria bacterium]|nr:MAG: glycosyltransferase family 2 protein [Candidatus Melainabacteria bacterium]
MSAQDLVSIVIPNWNGKKFLAGCLNSLAAQTYSPLEVIVIDNGSVDGSVAFLKTNYPWVKLIRFDHNTGFSVAVNAGILQASGSLVALLNNDTIVDSDWLAELVRALSEHPEAGSVACKMLAYDDKSILDGAGDGYRRGGLPGRIGHREKDLGQFDQPRYVLGACGGAAMYRRQLFDAIGLFDEDYFAYLEDVDMGLRAQRAGFKCYYVPAAVVYHLGCGTTGSGYSPMVVRLSSQNNINTIVKNIPAKLLWRFLPQIIYWQTFYLAVVIIRGGQLLPWLQGIAGAIWLLPKMLSKRDQIRRLARVSDDYLEEIIVASEQDLAASKRRLHAQVSQLNQEVSSDGVVSSISRN